MFKRVCDKCQSDKEVKTYTVPVPKDLYACGGKGNKPLIYWGTEVCEGTIDLCEDCSRELMDLISIFKYRRVLEK